MKRGCCDDCKSDEVLKLEVSEDEMKNLTGLTAKDVFGDFLGFHVSIINGTLRIIPRYVQDLHITYECELPRLAKAVRKLQKT